MRRPLLPLLHHAVAHDPAVQVRPYQPDDSGVRDALPKAVNEDVVVDPVEELLQINVYHDSSAGLHVRLGGQNRFVRPSSGTETVAVPAECRIKDRLQHLQQSLLDQPIRHRRYAELALAAVRFRDRYPSYRTGPVRPLQQLLAQRRPYGDQLAGGLVYVQPIHASGSFVGPHALERLQQVLSRQRCHEQR